MVKIPENVKKVGEAYLKDLSTEIQIDKGILFGSYAKGNYSLDSDVDLAIFPDSFKDMDRIESIKYLLKRARKFRGIDLQPISFTKQDYEDKIGIVEEVLKTGIEIYKLIISSFYRSLDYRPNTKIYGLFVKLML